MYFCKRNKQNKTMDYMMNCIKKGDKNENRQGYIER